MLQNLTLKMFVPRWPLKDLESESESENFESESEGSYVGHADKENKQPHIPNHQELDDLIRDLGLTKSNAGHLTSTLGETF